MADDMNKISTDRVSSSPTEDYDPLKDDYFQNTQFDENTDDLDVSLSPFDSPCSSMELDRDSMLRYGVTPPQTFYARIRRQQKEKDRSQKIKVAKRDSSLTKQRQLKTIASTGEMESFTSGSEGTLEPEPPPSNEVKKTRSMSKNMTTSRKYDRDYKQHSDSLTSNESIIAKPPAGISVPNVHVDSPNRFRCLHSVPASGNDLHVSKEDNPPAVKRLLSEDPVECSQERKDFHKLFTQLVNLHTKPKSEKEGKSQSPLCRQLSADEEIWRNQRSDLIWLEVRAWFHDRKPIDEDMALCKLREQVSGILEDIANFKYKRKCIGNQKVCKAECDTDDTDDINQPLNESSYLAEKSSEQKMEHFNKRETENDIPFIFSLDEHSDDVHQESEAGNFALPNVIVVSNPDTTGLAFVDSIREQQNALLQVSEILDKLDFVYDLYPTRRIVAKEHKLYNSSEFQFKIEVLCVWLNITRDVGKKIQLMADVLGVAGLDGLNWPWLDFESPLEKLQRIRDATDAIIPEVYDSDDESYDYTPETTPSKHRGTKLVKFEDGSKASTGSNTPTGLLSPSDASTPKRTPNFPVHHSNSWLNVEFTSRTSLYRYFVDRNLKKMGLGKLLTRLKDLLDGSLQRAKQVLERPPRIRQSNSFLDLQDEECPNLTALSSSPSIDGTPTKMIPVNSDICGSDFQEMCLPSFKPSFLFLVRIPLDVIHECIRLRLEQVLDTPSIHSVKQLIHECKEVLTGGVLVKQYYQQMVHAVTQISVSDTAGVDFDLEEFDNDLHRILLVYFDYIQSHMNGLQQLPDMTKHLKNFLEEEWNFAKEVCPHVRNGEAYSGKIFCVMTSSLLESISDFLLDGMDECINQLYDSTLGDQQEEETASYQLHRHGSRGGERKHAITETCRHIKANFQDARERATKALMFAKTLRKDLEIASEFMITIPHPDEFLTKLNETNHVQVITSSHSPSCLMFIPASMAENKAQILQLLDVTCGREDVPLNVSLEPDGYLLLVKGDHQSEAPVENHRVEGPRPSASWSGPTVHVEPTAETTIALSHLAVESLLLVVIHSSQLAEQRRKFKARLDGAVQLVCEQTSCHQSIAESLAQLKTSAMELRDRLEEAIIKVDQKLTMNDHTDMDEKMKPDIRQLYQATLHQCYNIGFEYHKEVMRLVSDDLRRQLSRQMVGFAKQWMKFVADKCDRGHGLKPRWATHGLDFLTNVCDLSVLAVLSENEFQDLKKEISNCITHVIGEKTLTRGGFRRSSIGLSAPHNRYLRNQSCPEPYGPRSSRSSSITRHASSTSEPSTPFVGANTEEDSSLRHTSSVKEITAKEKLSPSQTRVELGEGDDGGIIIEIKKDPASVSRSASTATVEEPVAPIERVRHSIHELEQQYSNRLYGNQQIGRVTRVNPDVDYPISIRRVNFQWQRGMKIGQGQFGKVYTAVNIDSGELLAMKQITFQHNDHKTIKAIADEIKIFEGIHHENLVRYYGVEVHRGEMLIFMEFCSAGTLEDVSKQGLTEPQIRRYTNKLLKAVNVLHDNAIVHRDIKGANIFLTVDGSLKLGDFGCSVKLKNYNTMPGEVKSMKGTIAFMAPEVINEEESDGSGRAADVWSLGCVVIQMITGKRPWHEMENDYMVMFKIGMGGKPSVPESHVSAEGLDFIEHCHDLDPKTRWTAGQLEDHPFAKVFDEDDESHKTKSHKPKVRVLNR